MADLSGISAELILSVGFLLVIVVDLFSRRSRMPAFVLTLLTLLMATLPIVFPDHLGLTHPANATLFSGMLQVTPAGEGFKAILYLVSALFAVFAFLNTEVSTHRKGIGDLFSVLLGLTLGMSLMTMSSNLLMIFLSVELVSIASYLLVGYTSAGALRAEAALKYVLFGAVSSAVMLYGMSLLYALTGSLTLGPSFVSALSAASPSASIVALAFVAAGIGFKLSFVPMHVWTPDVYEGAPTPVTALLAAGPKLSGFAMLCVLQQLGLFSSIPGFQTVSVLVAILTMIVGNFAALWQDSMKRMLAYSSIGHTGFMLMAVLSDGPGYRSLLFYGLVYALATFGLFLLADHFEEQTGAKTISAYKGFGKHFPLAMTAMVLLLVSMTGLPPTAGFFAKLLVFRSVLGEYRTSGSVTGILMLVTGAVTTVVSLFYYFKVPLNAWLRAAEYPANAVKPLTIKVMIGAVLALLIIVLGLFPGLIS